MNSVNDMNPVNDMDHMVDSGSADIHMKMDVHYNGIKFGSIEVKNKQHHSSFIARIRRHSHKEVILCRGGCTIRGYFARTDENVARYDLFVGFIITKADPVPSAKVYRVVCDSVLTILNIHRPATESDRAAARTGRVCAGVRSSAKNTDVFRIVNGVRITVVG